MQENYMFFKTEHKNNEIEYSTGYQRIGTKSALRKWFFEGFYDSCYNIVSNQKSDEHATTVLFQLNDDIQKLFKQPIDDKNSIKKEYYQITMTKDTDMTFFAKFKIPSENVELIQGLLKL